MRKIDIKYSNNNDSGCVEMMREIDPSISSVGSESVKESSGHEIHHKNIRSLVSESGYGIGVALTEPLEERPLP
jgi:hypothetical protein